MVENGSAASSRPTGPSNLFVSYRRPLDNRTVSLATRLGYLLKRRWASRGDVFLDQDDVTQQGRFAHYLVDGGLNVSVAVLAIIDDDWLDPFNLGRLGRSDDWTTFELSYAVEHELCIVLIGSERSRNRFALVDLRGSLQHLRSAAWFSWDEAFSFDAQGKGLVAYLDARLPGHRRRPSELHAEAWHSQPREVSLAEAKNRLVRGKGLYLVHVMLEWSGYLLQVLGMVALLIALVSWSPYLAAAAFVMTLFGVWLQRHARSARYAILESGQQARVRPKR